LQTKKLLKYPPVVFDGRQARSVAMGFAHAAHEGQYHILACAVLPNHVHLVIARDGRLSERIMSHLKRAASIRLRCDGLHPFSEYPLINGSLHTPWSAKGWRVYLDSAKAIARSIAYVEANPEKEGLRRQRWSFVKPLNLD
jgi:REP element-mobilizing transposase RayT